MLKPLARGSMLLLSTALTAPGVYAQAPAGTTQTTPPTTPSTPGSAAAGAPGAPGQTATQADAPEEQVEVSTPGADPTATEGGDIVVTGRYIPDAIRATPEVISVLSTADIARTGEGDIAGALQRVTGLSVVGAGFVYVRGLGDRYSLALLNGSPLPSPEPLRRVVPLDIFPTSVLASAVVQKSYSVNYPGEFGGGVINLTTASVPEEPFLSFGTSVSGDSETTAKLGYTYDGGDTDFLGFDDGTRDAPRGLRDAIASGNPLVAGSNYTARQVQDITASLVNAETSVLQRNSDIPANFNADLSGGTSFDFADGRVGLITAAGYSSAWRTRDALQQRSTDPELAGQPTRDFRAVITDNRVIVNGLLGLGAEFGDNRIRWTNLYIRDTVKQGRLAAGYDLNVAGPDSALPPSLIQQNTYWFERQLIDTQFVGEFKIGDLSLDLRGTYANSQRESPYERGFSYFYAGDGNPDTKADGDADDYVNNLSSPGQSADIAFSDLNENVYGASGDLAYKLPTAMDITLTGGYNYSKTTRDSSRYQYQFFRPDGALSFPVAQQRPDFLLSDYNVYTYNIQLRDVSGAEGSAAYGADLRVHAGYGQFSADLFEGVQLIGGVRYEDGRQRVVPIGAGTQTSISNDYWLPAGTLTVNFLEDMQIRFAASKTLARPQFRELAQQIYQDFESDRQFTGNPFLVDSELTNAEARYEWYFGRGQRLSLAGFYKKIENPIEAVAFFAGGNQLRTGFANAPEASLYGGEVELQKYVRLDDMFDGEAFQNKRLVLIGNYTYTKSELKVDDSLVISPDLQPLAANTLFRDGAPLTGQSDHLVNVQVGIEDTERLQQATVLFNYASERVTNRGAIVGDGRQPDILEKPGIRVDFVAREEVQLLGAPIEIKFEARNLTGTDYQEFQRFGENRIDINSYDVGRSVSLGMGVKF